MRKVFTDSPIVVNAGSAWSGIASRPETLQIVSGSAWITIEGERSDYWLSPGDRLAIAPQRLVVIEPEHGDSRVEAVTPAPHGIGDRLADLASSAWNLARHVVTDRIGGGAAQPRDINPCSNC